MSLLNISDSLLEWKVMLGLFIKATGIR